MKPWLVIGVGNEMRGDDGAGLAVVRRLKQRRPTLEVRECGGEALDLMEAWENARAVILVDAMDSGSTRSAGVCHYDLRREPLPVKVFSGSTHGFSLVEAVELARALDRLPPEIVVFGVEGKDFGHGRFLSDLASRNVEETVSRILTETGE